MDPTSETSSWIWAYKSGDALQSASTSEDIQQHDNNGVQALNLKQATGGDSTNPFMAASVSASSSSGSSASATGMPSTGSSGNPTSSSVPVATVASSDSGSSSNSDSNSLLSAHAALMTLAFLVFFPLGVLVTFLPISNAIVRLHAPIQILSLCLLIAGLGTGAKMASDQGQASQYHPIIGYVTVACLVLLQPIGGLLQHIMFKRHGRRTIFGEGHRWFGRALIVLGMVNGGLGAGLFVSPSTMWLTRIYEVVAPIEVAIWIGLAVWKGISQRRAKGHDSRNGLDGFNGEKRNPSDEVAMANGNSNGSSHAT